MNQNYIALALVAILVAAGVFITPSLSGLFGNSEKLVFDQIPYNYTSHVWIPPNTANGSSLGGYYNIAGKGQDFTFHLVLSGAEKTESPLDYVASGLSGQGHVNEINITDSTIYSLLSGDFKGAMMGTKFNGNMNMSCAAWNGTSQFKNNGQNFVGTFVIIGPMTDWKGTYRLVNQEDQIAMIADYIYYPHGQKRPDNTRRVVDTFYL
jgi:hypothetical protein